MFARTSFATLLLTAFVLFSACRSAQKFVESGDYDAAIEYCVDKLEGRKNKKSEYVKGLELAFQKAQARDLAAAENLIAQKRPENWERVNAIHRQIAKRQNRVLPLVPLRAKDGYEARFDFVDIAKLENESCERAADYLYTRAESLLKQAETGDRNAAREAWTTLLELERRYFTQYREKDRLKQEARNLGTAHVLFEIKNQSNRVVPRQFSDRILAIGKNDLDSEWKSYHFNAEAGVQYDYKVVFNLNNLDNTPERVHERSYADEREIEDGWDYVLDSRGNVMKDSLGNDLKTPRYVRIHANVLEVYQSKAVRLAGTLQIFEGYRNTLLETRPVGTEVIFENYASTFTGDKRALSDESRRRIGNRPLPFPTDEDLLAQAADRLKPSIRDELRRSNSIR